METINIYDSISYVETKYFGIFIQLVMHPDYKTLYFLVSDNGYERSLPHYPTEQEVESFRNLVLSW